MGHLQQLRDCQSEFDEDYDPTAVREHYTQQTEVIQNCKDSLDVDKVKSMLEANSVMEFLDQEKMLEILNKNCGRYKTWLKWKHPRLWIWENGGWNYNFKNYDLIKSYSVDQHRDQYYCRNGESKWHIDLPKYSEKGVVLYHQKTSKINADSSCRWNFTIDPTKITFIELYKPTKGEINIVGMIDEVGKPTMTIVEQMSFFFCNETAPVKTKYITASTHLYIAVEKLTEEVNYTIVVRQEDIPMSPLIVKLIFGLFLTVAVVIFFSCWKLFKKNREHEEVYPEVGDTKTDVHVYESDQQEEEEEEEGIGEEEKENRKEEEKEGNMQAYELVGQ